MVAISRFKVPQQCQQPLQETKNHQGHGRCIHNIMILAFSSLFSIFLIILRLNGALSFFGYQAEESDPLAEPFRGFHVSKSEPTITADNKIAPTTSEAVGSHSCAKILDALDDQYNQRRKPRHSKQPGWDGKKLFDLFEPEATCFSEERFGSESEERFDAFGDGPKFVCGVDVIAANAKADNANGGNSPGCLVYSVGSNNDIRFEKAIHTHMKGCEIHTFDPTLDFDDFIGKKYATFHPWGLGTDGGKEGQTMHGRNNDGIRKSFDKIIKELGHVNRTIDILKIDCQGCEYAAMPPLFDLISSGKVSVNQVLIELHRKSPQILYDFFLAADRAKFRLTHKERNQWGCDGSRCVEYAFVSESFLREANGAIICPAIGDY